MPWDCDDSTAFTISVAPMPIVNAGNDVTICYSDSVQLNGQVNGGLTPYTYSWSPDTALSNSTILNPWRSPIDTSIAYVLTVTDSLGCVYTDTVNVNIFPLVSMDAGNDRIVCINEGAQSLGGTPSGGTWTGTAVSGGNTFTPSVAGLGNHTLTYTYTDANGCMYVDSLIMQVIQQPSLNFVLDVDSGCTDLTVTISDSTGVAGHRWYANNTLFSTAKNPSITISNSSADQDSIVSIKLVFTAGSGCIDSLSKDVVIFPKPSAAFSLPPDICAGDVISPQQNSVFKGVVSANYLWSASSPLVTFNDSSLASPSISFPDFQNGTDSIYSIQLILTSVDGCIDTVSNNILVHSRPTAAFTLPAASCTPHSINPANTSVGNQLTYIWSVTPTQNVTLTNSTDSSGTFSFTTPSSDSIVYSITLTVTDSAGCTDAITQTYTTYPQPQMAFTASQDSGCTPFTITFTNASVSGISGQQNVLTYQWDLGNGTTSTDTNAMATYSNTGIQDTTYYIQLIATNSLGCSDTLTDSIVVHPDPRAVTNFTTFTDCAPYTIDNSVISASLFPNANGSYIWSVYDVNNNLINQYNGVNALNHTLNTGGDSIYVELIAQSPFGCSNDTSARQLFYTIVNPVADFTAVPDSGCSVLQVSLVDNSTAGVSHQWYVEGIPISTAQNPTVNLRNISYSLGQPCGY